MGEETSEELMRATYRALCEHGYANLTMQDIADESSKSKAALHYHYDSKTDLIAAFQDYLAERFFERVCDAAATADGPTERLAAVLDAALSPPEHDDHLDDIQTALLELKAQAPYESALRERSLAFDAEFRGLFEEILEAGVEDGVFRADLDTEATARFVATVLAGAQTRHASVGQSPAVTRELLATYVDRHVIADPREAPVE